ncbi:MAG TPA: type II secretion system F family protein [Candidatus Angelobacter sp.]|nr:type II secretion system F family protein [Candidatus Angelobacter sp.]
MIAANIAAPMRPLHRPTDPARIPTQLALAPRSWAARCVASTTRAWQSHPQQSSLPDLLSVIAGIRLVCILALAAPTIPACFVLLGLPGAAAAGALSAGLGRILPDLRLAIAARAARHDGARDAAAAIDLLAATATAGLTLPEAMVLTAGHAPPAIAAALRAAAVRRAMGEEARVALAEETQRFGAGGLAVIAQAVERQRRLGVPLGPELAQLGARLRAEERTTALQRAARRGPIGTLLIALVIAPICIAAVVACVVGGLIQGGTLAAH